MDPGMLLNPFGVGVDLVSGVMDRPDRHVVRNASAMRGYYADAAALERLIAEQGDPLHYETFEKDVPNQAGQLCFCISQLQPGRVGDECFMTKGHYHTVADTAEVYLCLRGQGYMLMKTPPDAQGHSRAVAEPMQRNRLVYVPPYWAHRSINTGNEPLISLCIYPGHAGHNYGDIATEGFPQRVLLRDGKIVICEQASKGKP
jgi:glucose-6-phosphate isomerase, archaeal